MSIELIPCSEFPEPFHPLTCAFVNDPTFRAARFPTTASFWEAPTETAALLHPPERQQNRNALIQAVRESMDGLSLTSTQTRHLQELSLPLTVAVTTGQQVGFLGGPLYIALKAVAAVSLALQLRTLIGRPVVPFFWVEDNDSDGREAGSTSWWEHDGTLTLLSAAPDAELMQPLSIANRHLLPGGQWEASIERIETALPAELSTILRMAYQPESSWSQAFVRLLQWLVGPAGMLFLRSSIARTHGLLAPILEQALCNEDQVAEALQQATAWLYEHRYPVRITPSLSLLHFHTPEGFRYRIRRLRAGEYAIAQQRYTPQHLRELFAQNPTAFSPTALLRPLCQDSILPTLAVVLGPAELAYWAQLRELYELFTQKLPVVTVRPSLTLVPPLIQGFLVGQGLNARQFLTPWQNIVDSLLSRSPVAETFGHPTTELYRAVQQWYEHLLPQTQALDPTLIPSLGAARHRIEQALQRWERRIHAAFRRRHEILLHRVRRIWGFLFPNGQPQERVLSWLQLAALCGTETFHAALQQAATLPSGVHAVLTVPAEAETSARTPAPYTAGSPPQ